MRITWNPELKRFETLLSGSSFSADKDLVSAAGMNCTGPPDWVWHCSKAKVLQALRGKAQMSISPEAMQNFERLRAQEAANAEVLKALRDAKKAQKREKAESGTGTGFEYDEDGWAIIEPGESQIWSRNKYVPPPPPSTLCGVCKTPIYAYECQEPPLCLDCEFAEEL
jgi:hypothetical protein